MRYPHKNTNARYWRNVDLDALLTLCVATPIAILVFIMLRM
jgi:hypothetical protein